MGYANILISTALKSSDNGNKSLRYNIGYITPSSANTFVYSEAAILDQINKANKLREKMMEEYREKGKEFTREYKAMLQKKKIISCRANPTS